MIDFSRVKNYYIRCGYAADGTTITATCANTDFECTLTGDTKIVGVTLTADDAEFVADTPYSDAGTDDGTTHFSTETGETVTIVYAGRGSTTYAASTIPPTNAGDYTATVTLTEVKTGVNSETGEAITGDVTVSADFEITEAAQPIAPKVLSHTDTSITVSAVQGQEYSIDGGKTWVKPAANANSVTFDNLEPGKDYKVQTRFEGDTNAVETDTNTSGDIGTNVDVGNNVPATTVNGLTQEVARKLCTKDQLQRVEDGEFATVYLVVTKISPAMCPRRIRAPSPASSRAWIRTSSMP